MLGETRQSQTKGRSPVCVFTWLLRFDRWRNARPHPGYSQVKGRVAVAMRGVVGPGSLATPR